MAIDNTKVIDAVFTDPESGHLILTAFDPLEWQDNNAKKHLFLLQEKINTYLTYIESGEFYSKHPDKKALKVEIQILGRFDLSPLAQAFYEKAKQVVSTGGFELHFIHSPGGD